MFVKTIQHYIVTLTHCYYNDSFEENIFFFEFIVEIGKIRFDL